MSANRPEATDVLLTMEDVSKSFGATAALRNVSLQLRPGEVMALVGENGAGKSTMMKILSGALSADSGRLTLAGKPYAPKGTHDARHFGVAMIYQELNLATDLSVEDNIMLGQEIHRYGFLRRVQQQVRVREALELLGHPELRPEVIVGALSVGARQLVEIARSLVMQARVIIFDEPTSSLTRQDAEHLFEVIGKLKTTGLGIIYISHFLEEIRRVCDRFTVLRDGQSVGCGELADASEKKIVELMVGRKVQELFPIVPHEPGEPILSLDLLSGAETPRDVTFELRRGEILGIAGLVGAGRTELLRAIFGLDEIKSGKIRIAGKPPAKGPRGRIMAGLGLVSEDRKNEGLAQIRSIADNITYSRLAPYSRFGWLNLRLRQEAVVGEMERMHIKARSGEQSIDALSGGNQQKVAVARVLHQQAEILLLDEPTRGIDVGTKAEIYRLIGNLAAQGKAIIFVSSYLPELMAVCDRVGVMSRGQLQDIRPTADWTEEEIMASAVRWDSEL